MMMVTTVSSLYLTSTLPLSAIYALFHFNLPALQCWHFTEKGKEAERGKGTCPRSHKCVGELGVKILPVAKGCALLLTTGH